MQCISCQKVFPFWRFASNFLLETQSKSSRSVFNVTCALRPRNGIQPQRCTQVSLTIWRRTSEQGAN